MVIPAYLEDQTYAVLLQTVLDKIEELKPGLDLREGTIVWTFASTIALMCYQNNVNLIGALERTFIQTSFGDWLDLQGEENGLPRLGATAATGTVTFTGVDTTVIPAGTRVSTASTTDTPAQVYETNILVTMVGTTEDAAVTAVTVGANGNAGISTVQLMETQITGINAVNNAAAFSGGADEESDDDYRDRLLLLLADRSSSGNIADYTQWALDVAGVGGVSVIPLWNGAGTVKVALLGDTKLPAAGGVVTAATTYIATQSPIGATVTVVAATGVPITVAADLTITAGYVEADVRVAAYNALVAHFADIAFDATDTGNGNDVKYSKIGAVLYSVPGVDDYATLTVNAGTANIAISTVEVATMVSPGTFT